MTAFGKLLIFMNLVFAVVTGALIVFVFTTRANWVGAYRHAEGQAKAAEAAYKAEKAAHENDIKQKDASAKELEAQVTRLNSQVATAQGEAQSARDLAAKQENVNRTANTDSQRLQAELNQIRDERAALDKEKTALRERVIAVQKERDKQVEIAVTEGLRARNMEQKANNLLRQVEELTVRNRELETNVSAGSGTGAGANPPSILDGSIKPPPKGVRGRVTGVGNTGTALAQIDIGSDSGLSVGNVLIVFRGMEYLGDLTLTTVNAKIAVGKFAPNKKTSVIQKDDQVATSLGGSEQ